MVILGNERDLWSLTFDDFKFLAEQIDRVQLDLAVKLLCYRIFGEFIPYSQIDRSVLYHVGEQLRLKPSDVSAPKYVVRTDIRRRDLIKSYLDLNPQSETTLKGITAELSSDPNLATLSYDELRLIILRKSVNLKLLPPPTKWLQRAHETLRNKVDETIFLSLTKGMSRETKIQLESSLNAEPGIMSLSMMRDSSGAASKTTFDMMAARVGFINDLKLSNLNIRRLDLDWKDSVVRRVDKFKPAELRRMRKAQRLGMYSVYLSDKHSVLTDSLIKTLIDAVAKMQRTKEANIAKSVGKRSRQIYSHEQLIQKIVQAAVSTPDRPIGSVVFELIDLEEARKILGEKSTKNTWAQDLFGLMKSSWSTYYRGMLRTMLQTVQFRSNNTNYQPLLKALDWIHLNYKSKGPYNLKAEGLSIEGVVPPNTGLP